MNWIVILFVAWLICAIVRTKLFVKLEMEWWKSLIPFYGTYLVFEKVWDVNVFWGYMICFIVLLFIWNHGYIGMSAALLEVVCSIGIVYGWTGHCFYMNKYLKGNIIMGYGLAILFPVFGLILGFQKESMNELESEN